MRAIYNFLFAVFFPLSAPYYFLKMWRRGHWREGFAQRFGRYSHKVKQGLTNREMLWLHAVSVGEVNLCTQLIRALEPRAPNLKIVVSTTTTTGMGELQKRLPAHIEKVYYPVDYRRCVHRAIATIHPKAVVLVEAEVWPNFLWRLRDKRIPAFLVNARLSDRSYRGYKLFRFFFRRFFASFKGVGAQSEADAAKLIELGCRPKAVRVVGSLKFDAAKVHDRRLLDVPALLRQIGVPEGSLFLLGGSTHSGEEAVLADIFKRLRQRFPTLFLILVPRHFERGKKVGKKLEARGIKFMYRSAITAATQLTPGTVQCLLVNTTGELRFFYPHADVVFVGKSLMGRGGQNPVEPGALGKAMVFGPSMRNFAAIAESFVAGQGAIQVRDAAQLERVLGELLADEPRRLELGQRALAVVQANTGGLERTVDMILERLEEGGGASKDK